MKYHTRKDSSLSALLDRLARNSALGNGDGSICYGSKRGHQHCAVLHFLCVMYLRCGRLSQLFELRQRKGYEIPRLNPRRSMGGWKEVG